MSGITLLNFLIGRLRIHVSAKLVSIRVFERSNHVRSHLGMVRWVSACCGENRALLFRFALVSKTFSRRCWVQVERMNGLDMIEI